MVYGDFKDLPRRILSNYVWRDKAFNIAKNPKCDRCQWGLASIVYKVFGKTSSALHANKFARDDIQNKIRSN